MWFLYFLTWVAFIVQLFFIVISVAAGLYYLSELVEEFSVASRKIILWMSLVDLIIYACLAIFEEFPLIIIVTGILSQVTHIMILSTFPIVVISSPTFIAAVLLFFVNHYLAFSFFSDNFFPFSEVLAFFTLCLWLVPFALFVSLSANEYVLPTHSETSPLLGDDDAGSNYFSKSAITSSSFKGKKYGLRSFFKYAQETILPYQNKKSY